MAASTQGTLEGIERRRAQLQDSVEKLHKALTHWTTWEAEYQALREEVEGAEDASPAQIRELAQNLDSALLDSNEVEALLGKDLQTKRTANQVLDIISRRIDYVQQNSATIEKQLDVAEKQLAGVDVLLEPGVENEDGLPMMDIEEELDDQGNEIASSINQTGKAAAELVEILRKAGLQKATLEKQHHEAPGESSTQSLSVKDGETLTKSPAGLKPAQDEAVNVDPPRKSVSFVDDNSATPPKKGSALESEGYNDILADMNFTRGTKVIELDQDDNEIASYPIIPQGESAEDAELRRQMLQYGLSEVGQIVAELDLDHPTVEYSEGEDDDDYGNQTDDDEAEDEYGRSTKSMLSDDYRKQMLQLEEKLNARMMENIGPKDSKDSLVEHASSIRTMRVKEDEQFDSSMEPATVDSSLNEPKKKGVRFATDLDVSRAPEPRHQSATGLPFGPKTTSTIKDTIVERPPSGSDRSSLPSSCAKMSRFKNAKAETNTAQRVLPTPPVSQAPVVPKGPSGRTMANTIIEHDSSTMEPNAPDEFDPILLNQEIQADYHRARNKFIQQQGGFKPTEDDEEGPIVEEKDGKTRKVSRFMASRLKASGM